jgi:glutamate racemase
VSAIGVFDSGVGGLTVVAALKRRLPEESILFLGDTARLPYGTKSPETVIHYTRRNVDFLQERGVKAIVVACNTASALALDSLDLPIPAWGVVEPGARRAAKIADRHVAVLATESTVRSGAYPTAILRACANLEISALEITSVSCPLFVPLVEEGWQDDPITLAIARRYLEPLIDRQIDTVVLGCTHYPLLQPLLRQVVGDHVRFVDSAQVTAEHVAVELERLGLLTSSPGSEDHFFVTDAAERFRHIAARILGLQSVNLEHVDF